MRKKLFLCNTVYQIFVALWMQHDLFKDDIVDIIISDHLAGGQEICNRIKEAKIFDSCYYVESFLYARKKIPLTDKEKKYIRINPVEFLNKYVKLEKKYDDLYVSNVDNFSRLLYNSVIRGNKKCCLSLFEDGLSTYTKIFEGYYYSCIIPFKNRKERLISRYIYREKSIFGNVDKLFLFNPKYLIWRPNFDIVELNKIESNDSIFVDKCNKVFGVESLNDKYEEPYIFMEESFNVEGAPINDIELLEQLSKRIGKQNIFVKRHPRERANRFEGHGFKTNTDQSIPWEVILLNIKNLSNKRIISVCSGSMFNSVILFNCKVKAYSIFNLIDSSCRDSFTFDNNFWEVFQKIIECNPQNITLCSSIDDIV